MDKEFAEAFKEEIEKEASTYTDKARDDEKKKKKHFAFGGKKKSRHGESGYAKGEEKTDMVMTQRRLCTPLLPNRQWKK